MPGGTVQISASSDILTYDSSAVYSLDIELRPAGVAFSNTSTHAGGQIFGKPEATIPYPLTTISGLTPGAYKWQVRERTDWSSTPGTWVQFNGGLTAFTVTGVTVLPATTSFGVVRTGQTSAPMTVEVANDGQVPVTLNAASVSAGGPFTLVSGPTLPMTLSPGARASFTVTATPTSMGAHTGTFSVSSSEPNSPHAGALTVTGGQPGLTLGQPSINFGETGANGAGSTRNLTVNNSGNLPLEITGATTAAPFSIIGPTAVTVSPGASHSFELRYVPTALGNDTGSLTITSDAPSSPHTVPLSGAGIDPRLVLDRTTVSFPDVAIHASSAPVTITVSNTGIGTLALGTPVVTGPFTTSLTARPVAVGDTTTFTVTFSPTTPGPKTGTLSLPSNDAATPATLTLSGLARAPGLEVAPLNHAFGIVNLGVSQTSTFTLTNPGDATVDITGMSITGTNPSEFTLQGAPPSPFTLAAGATTQFSVTFAPSGVGVRSASVQIQSNRFPAGNLTVPLTGTGEGAKLTLSTTGLNFGFVNVGSTSVRTVDVGNTGSLPLTVNGLTFNTGAANDYATSLPVPFTVQPGTNTPVVVSFNPTAVGSRASVLTIASNDGLNPAAEVALSGSGLSPQIVVTPDALNFGVTRVGQTSNLSVTVRNAGSGTLNLSSATITGGDAQAFTVSSFGSGFALAPNGPTRTIGVTFKPTFTGAASSSLVIVSDDPDMPNLSLPLSGEGVAPGLALSATSLNFGGQLVRVPSSTRTVTLTNTGNAPLQVGKVTVSGAGAPSFAVADPVGSFVLPVGGEREVKVIANPAGMGELNARLDISTDAPGAVMAHVDLVALGLSEILSLSQASVDFGAVKLGAAGRTFQFTVTNAASDAVSLAGASFTGSSSNAFSAELSATTIPGHGTVTVTVRFTPTSAGAHSSDLTLASTDALVPAIKVNVKGTGVSQILVAEPATISFGAVPSGESREQTVTLTNKSSSEVTITGFTSDASQFTVVSAPPVVMAPGGTAQITVAFAPTSALTAQATLGILLDGAAAEQPELNLSASGSGTFVDEGGCSSAGGNAMLWALLALMLPALRRNRTARR